MYGAPGQAPYGTMPGMYPPGYAVPPGYGVQPGAPGVGAPAQPRVLPRWFLFGAAGLIVVGLLLVWLTGSDWANSGLRVGIGALVVAALVLIAFVIGRTQGFRSTRIVSMVLVSVLILIILGAAGITLQGPVHSLQGGALEGQSKFVSAISEFNAAGNTLGVARTYNDWGDSLLSTKIYSLPDDPTQTATDGALQKYQFVLSDKNITQSSDPDVLDQVTRAKNGVVKTVLAWGDAHLSNSDYQGAVDRFKVVLDQKDTYVTATSFAQLHLEAAKAYYGLGQQQLSSSCSDAVQTYQIIVKDYSDTPQGAQATNDLKKPQNVTGLVADYQTGQPDAGIRLFLSSNYEQALTGGAPLSNDFTTVSDSTGKFTFANITPGTTKYLISYIQGGQEAFIVNGSTKQPIANFIVQVTPLCATDVGAIPYNLPSA